MYLADVESLGDELLLSETSVRKAWNEVMESMNVSIRSNPIMSKCAVCLKLRSPSIINSSAHAAKDITLAERRRDFRPSR